MEIDIGAEVFARDGKLGVVEKVVMDPARRLITHLVIGSGVFAHRERVVTLDQVASGDRHRVDLNLTLADAAVLPEYLEEHFQRRNEDPFGQVVPSGIFWPSEIVGWYKPDTPHEPLPSGAIEISPGTEVCCTDGCIGRVEEVLLDQETGQATGMVVRRGFFFHREFTAPIDWIEAVGSDRVLLRLSKAELDQKVR